MQHALFSPVRSQKACNGSNICPLAADTTTKLHCTLSRSWPAAYQSYSFSVSKTVTSELKQRCALPSKDTGHSEARLRIHNPNVTLCPFWKPRLAGSTPSPSKEPQMKVSKSSAAICARFNSLHVAAATSGSIGKRPACVAGMYVPLSTKSKSPLGPGRGMPMATRRNE